MINIIDGFYLSKSAPIDSRIVASGSQERDAIPYKYEGLRVFDISDSIPYVWINNSWQIENKNGVVASNTTQNYIPYLTDPNVISNSVIYQSNDKIGINTQSPSQTLDVNGIIKANGFIGNGSGITNINASNISGKLQLSNLPTGGNGYILTGSVSNPVYVDPTNITVGKSNKVKNITDTSPVNHSLLFVNEYDMHASVKTNTLIQCKPSTGQLILNNNGNKDNPILSIGASNIGFYKEPSELSLSYNGSKVSSFGSNTTKLINTKINSGTYDFTITGGTNGWDTVANIASVNYDRIFYLYSDYDIFSTSIETGSFQLKISLGNEVIFNKLATNNYYYSWIENYTFILPATLSAKIEYKKNNLVWYSGTSGRFKVKSIKFGLS
jgi:hypothetical protein